MLLLALAWLLSGRPVWLAAQSSGEIWRVWSAENGLAESTVRAVTVSPRGAVWARHGEVDAISLLEGFVVQRIPSPGGPSRRVYQSRAGMVWTTDNAGLLQLVEDQWRKHPLEPFRRAMESFSLRNIRQPPVLPTRQDRVLVLLPDRLLEYRATQRAAETLLTSAETGLGSFLDMAADAGDGCWIGCEGGLLHLPDPSHRGTARPPAFRRHPIPTELPLQNLRSLLVRETGVTCTAEHLQRQQRVGVDFEEGRWRVLVFGNENPRFVWPSTRPDTWYGVTYVRFLRRLPEGRVQEVSEFRAGQYFDVALEPDGAFWMASSEGLVRCAPANWQPAWHGPTREEIYSSVESPDGRLWFAAQSGLWELDRERWQQHGWPAGWEPGFGAGRRLHALSRGGLLVPGGDGWWRFDPAGEQWSPARHPSGAAIRAVLHQGADGRVAVLVEREQKAGAGRLEWFDGERFEPWPEAPPQIQLGAETLFLARASNGDYWLGGSGSVARWREGRWQRFGRTDGYVDEGAICWLERPGGRIWCSGLDKILEWNGKRWRVLQEGLDRVRQLVPARDGSVWVASGSGVHRFWEEEWSSVGPAEGLLSRIAHTVLVDRRDRVWVGTARGLMRYHPRADIAPPRILQLRSEEEPGHEESPEMRFLAFGRDRWRFTPDERLLYSHRLDEGAWSPFVSSPLIVLPRPASGRHQLEVRAMDRNWNVQIHPSRLEFMVLLPWYRDLRVVVAAMVATLAILALIGLAVNRHLALRRSYREAERRVEEATAELRRATEALVQSQKMTALGTLAAGIAHDFNNILSIIKGSAQLIAANLGDPEKIRARVERIEHAVDQAGSVIRAMLGFSRARQHTPGPLELASVIEETRRLLGERFQRDFQVQVDLEPGLPQVRGVPDLLQQMLLNLILNAADAMPGGGEIRIAARRWVPRREVVWSLEPAEPPAVALLITDTGGGIPPEIKTRVFEPFFSTKPFSSRHGTGLGLYMCYEFARQMGLGLIVDSEVGKGSTFTIVLPSAGKPDRPAATQPATRHRS